MKKQISLIGKLMVFIGSLIMILIVAFAKWVDVRMFGHSIEKLSIFQSSDVLDGLNMFVGSSDIDFISALLVFGAVVIILLGIAGIILTALNQQAARIVTAVATGMCLVMTVAFIAATARLNCRTTVWPYFATIISAVALVGSNLWETNSAVAGPSPYYNANAAGGPHCGNCGAPLGSDAEFCNNCGARVTAQAQPSGAFCPSCGAKLEADAAFCPFCGNKIN